MRSAGALLALSVAALLAASPAGAGECWVAYDERYRATLGQAMGVNVPSRAGDFSSMAECQAALRQILSDPQYRHDKGLHRSECECLGGSRSGGGSSYAAGYSFGQQVAGTIVSSFLEALLSGLTAPKGPDGDEIRRRLEKQWAEEEVRRRAAEKKRQEELFRAAQAQATALLGGRPAGAGAAASAPIPSTGDGAVHLGTGTIPALLRSSGAVTEAQWADARRWQARIDELRAKATLDEAERRELAALEARRNGLWRRAVSVPGLTERERDALRLKLHVDGSATVVASAEDLMKAREDAPAARRQATSVLGAMTEASITFGVETAIDTAAEETAEELTEEVAKRLAKKGSKVPKLVKFGDVCLVGGVATAVVSGKPGDAAEPAMDWLVGKVVAVRPALALSTTLVQGAGAVTTAAAKKAFENLLDGTEKVVPGFMPPEGVDAFWKEKPGWSAE